MGLLLLGESTSASAQGSLPSGVSVAVGYVDNARPSGFFPTPWAGDPGIVFEGCSSGCTWDGGAVKITNTSGSTVTVNQLQVSLSTCTYNIWPTNVSVAPGQSAIYAQMVANGEDNGCSNTSGTFDTSDVGPNGAGWSGNCNESGVIPQVAVTVNGSTSTFSDDTQTLNTGGIDLASCPNGTNESIPWTDLNSSMSADQQFSGANGSCDVVQPVDCATGDFWHTFDEISIPGRGVPLDLALSYNSLAAANNSPIGYGWSFSYGMHASVDQSTGNVTVTQENGATVPFTNNGGTLQPPTYDADSLVHNGDGTYTFSRRHDGETFKFSAAGALLSITDRNGYSTTLSYSGSQLQSVTDSSGRSLGFTYGANGDISKVTDPGSRTVQFAYNGGELASITDTNAGVTSFTYDGSHRMLTMTDPRNGVLTNHYNSAGLVDSQTDPMNRTTTFAYQGGTTTVTDPKGHVTRMHFSNLLPVAVTQAYGTALEATWKYAYDAATLQATSITDPNGHASTATYDADGNQTSFKDALGHQTTATYNNFDEPLVVTDPSGVATTRTYDGNGNLTSVSRPLTANSTNQSVSYAYGDTAHPGDVTATTDGNGKTTQLTYDANGNVASSTDPAGDKSTFSYNSLGQLTSSVSPRGNVTGGTPTQYTTSYTYNGLGLVTQVTDPLGHIAKRTYDANGNLATATDPNTNATTYTYNADNELTQITRADATTLQYGYDADGNQSSQTDGKNQTTTYAYDAIDRLTSVTDALNRTTSYGYDVAGNRTSATDPSNRKTSYSYDKANELTAISYSDGSTPNVSFTYTSNGLRQTMTDGTGTTTYNYDSLNRLSSQQNGAGQTVSYGYDLNDQLTSLVYPDNHTVTRAYDSAGNLTKITDWLGHSTSFTPDADGNTTATTFGNGVTSTSVFDRADALTSITHKSAAGSTLAAFTYTRDSNGQLLTTAPSGVAQGSNESYTYDKLNRLTAVNTGGYSYDAAGNVTKLPNGTTLGYDAANEVTSYTPTTGTASTLGYDQQGNRTTGIGGATYAYDQANRLTSATGAPGSIAIDGAAEGAETIRRSDGTVWGWGYNGNGQLGNGTTNNSATPVQATGLTGATAVASGSYFTLAVKSDGTVSAWGDNFYGQLGNGTTTQSLTPTQVSGLSGATAVSAGHYHSLALKNDGTVWAWGSNSSGQLGNGTTTNSSTPVKVSNLTGVVQVAAGGDYSLALKSDGSVWAWGDNTYGQLGNNSTKSSSVPVKVANISGIVQISAAPPIAAGTYHSLALTSSGTVWAWGYNASGQLGNGTTKNSLIPVQVKNITTATGVAAGAYHSLAVLSDGSVWSWGYNVDGELGNGTTTNSSVPVKVSGLTGVSTIAAGDFTSYALGTDGSVSDWGYGGDGELGNGSTSNTTTPTHPTGLGNPTPATYTYDGDGLRASVTNAGNTKHFAWGLSSGLPLLLTDGATNYIYDDNGAPVEQIDANGTPLYYQHDQLGSTRLLTDQSGTSVATYSYDAYGNLTNRTGTADTPLRWGGEFQDAATGFYYLRARYYDPKTAQFLSRDPLEGLSDAAYAYGDESPLNAGDPSGLLNCGPGTGIAFEDIVIGPGGTIVVGGGISGGSIGRLGLGGLIGILGAEAAKKCLENGCWEKNGANKPVEHHIIAQTAKAAAPARRIWTQLLGQSINSTFNLVTLQAGMHWYLHTKRYYTAVNIAVAVAYYNAPPGDRLDAVRAALEAIAFRLETAA